LKKKDNQKISQKVLSVISKTLLVDIKDLDENTNMGDVKNWDSLNHLSLIISLEEEFNLNFIEDEIIKMISVSSIVDIINRKLS